AAASTASAEVENVMRLIPTVYVISTAARSNRAGRTRPPALPSAYAVRHEKDGEHDGQCHENPAASQLGPLNGDRPSDEPEQRCKKRLGVRHVLADGPTR